jgi:signal transduction histidine kinase
MAPTPETGGHIWIRDGGAGRPAAAEPRESARRTLSDLGKMTAGVAHDFLNFLAVAESALALAKRTEDLAEVRAYVAAAQDSLRRGVSLTNQLLDFAKHREAEPTIANPNELLRNLEVFLKYGAGPAISVVLELAADAPSCLIDASQFNAAILNLVVNAREAMPMGGEVRISTEHYDAEAAIAGSTWLGGSVRVRIQDNGQGMSPETLERIFDPFFTTKGNKGTGLGLPQVDAFMRLIGGHVTVASKQGHGTIVDLLFPAAAAAEG